MVVPTESAPGGLGIGKVEISGLPIDMPATFTHRVVVATELICTVASIPVFPHTALLPESQNRRSAASKSRHEDDSTIETAATNHGVRWTRFTGNPLRWPRPRHRALPVWKHGRPSGHPGKRGPRRT